MEKNILFAGAWKDEAYVATTQLAGDSFIYLETQSPNDVCLAGSYNGSIDINFNLNEFIEKNKITHIIPFDRFGYWALMKDELYNKGITVVSNCYSSCKIVEDYFELYKECKKNGIIIPDIYRNNNDINKLPLILKSRDKKEKQILKTMRDVYNFTSTRKDIVVQAYISGIEFNINFIKNSWVQFGYFPFPDKQKFRTTQEKDFITIQTSKIFDNIISCLGLTFGSLSFIISSGEIYFIDASPMFTIESLLINPNLFNILLKDEINTDKNSIYELWKTPYGPIIRNIEEGD
jgi:hypothetical protein